MVVMTDYDDAFEVSPVPVPGPDAVAPELFRGIYGMPSFVTAPSADLEASIGFWTGGLGFFVLFSVPGRLVHLRRWMFQDVLLVPADPTSVAPAPSAAATSTVSFAGLLGQIDELAEACRTIDADSVVAVRDTPWNTRDLEVRTPEGLRVVVTAAKPFDPAGEAAAGLAAIGITPPGEGGRSRGRRENGEHVR